LHQSRTGHSTPGHAGTDHRSGVALADGGGVALIDGGGLVHGLGIADRNGWKRRTERV
jgi:hypothetical protein